MKKITLIKSIDTIQAGHVYEHIFCMQLAEYFRSQGLYSYLDYNIDAKTYYSGYVKLEVTFYSKAALKHQKAITRLSLVIDDDVIDGAILQIMAEKFVDFYVNDKDELQRAIKVYDASRWMKLLAIDRVLPKAPLKEGRYIQLVPRNSRHFLVMKQTITLGKDVLEGWDKDAVYPIFMVISQMLTNNLQQVIADSSYCYSYDDTVTTTSGMKHANFYRIDKRQETKLTIEKAVTQELIEEMIASGMVHKLEAFFQDIKKHPALAPDDDFITSKTGVLVGAKGWSSIGTQAAIIHVLEHMTVEFKLDKTTQSLSISTLLNK